MKIAILGSGETGLALAAGFGSLGHAVMIGTRHTGKPSLEQWRKEHSGIAAGSYSEAAAFGEVIFLCTHWQGTKEAVEMSGIWNFKKKVLIDVTNPLDGRGPDKTGRLNLAPGGHNASGGEQVQAWLQDTMVVKALNSHGSRLMVKPSLSQGTPVMFIAGNDRLAKLAVSDLLSQLGWKDVIDIGGIEMSRHLESLYVLWFAYGFRNGGWDHAFAFLRQ
ncbi:NADPH-dependent F420 reductase [Chitinophaga sp. GCM10012297]|uniref:NAD(P)-binding domain-containing protein n=1 Tax=Chitinophaga chungangae TaxID=2821488 RepID=A0ABS3YI48_9BACT|nr:NAD(P)-binding domain-containing protein [Chitinophaga chungangae]MBO9154367.1 NAD(P)-binding domain-containing protein [Chitinophaga chungangae]